MRNLGGVKRSLIKWKTKREEAPKMGTSSLHIKIYIPLFFIFNIYISTMRVIENDLIDFCYLY